MFLCSGVELMVELSGDDCPEPVSEEAARMLKLFSIQASFPSVSHNWHFAHILSICQALWSWSLYLMYIAQICICITVCVCVCVRACVWGGHSHHPCKNGWTSWAADWVMDSSGCREPCIRSVLDPPQEGRFLGRLFPPIQMLCTSEIYSNSHMWYT